MNYSNPDDHVPVAERKNILIKERCWIAQYWLTYKKTPWIMIRLLLMNVTQDLNLFLKMEELWIIISHIWFCHRGIFIITNIDRFNLVPMYRYRKLMIQWIKIIQVHLMKFIYALRLICRLEIRLWPCAQDNWLQNLN